MITFHKKIEVIVKKIDHEGGERGKNLRFFDHVICERPLSEGSCKAGIASDEQRLPARLKDRVRLAPWLWNLF